MNTKEISLLLLSGFSSTGNLQFVTQRRLLGNVYRDSVSNRFIRTGPIENIRTEYQNHLNLLAYRFPIAPFSELIESEGLGFYAEDSLGDLPIGRMLYQRLIPHEEGLARICELAGNWSEASAQSYVSGPVDAQKIFANVHFEELCVECQIQHFLSKDILVRLYEKLKTQIESLSGVAWSHGDFNAMNLMWGGVIDFEGISLMPAGYDLVSLLVHNYWFSPYGQGRSLAFVYPLTLMQELIGQEQDRLQIKGGLPFSINFLLRGIWSTVGMADLPDEQQYRYNLLGHYIEVYLNEGDIKQEFLKNVKEINEFLAKQ